MRYFLFVLLTAMLVACTAGVSQETPSPVAIIIETQPPTADTPTETATRPPTDTPTETATLPSTDIPTETATPLPTLTPTPTTPFTDGYLLFFWDSETYARYIDPGFPEPVQDPKQDLYIAIPSLAPNAPWQFTPVLQNWLDWETHVPSWPTVTLSPDQTKIAFSVLAYNSDPTAVDLRSFYVYDLLEDQLIQLTQDHFSHYGLSWLPDNHTLSYGWLTEIYNINVSELQPQLLTVPSSKYSRRLLWSPDGKTLAIHLQSSPVSFGNETWFFDLSTNQLTMSFDHGAVNPNQIKWSADSQWLASNYAGGIGLLLFPSFTFIPLIVADSGGVLFDWAKDGSWLAYSQYKEAGATLSIWDPATLSTLQLAQYPSARFSAPVWANNLPQIAVRVQQNETFELLLFDLPSQQVRSLFASEGIYYLEPLTWSPDDQWLLFLMAKEGESGLYLIGRDGGESYQVLDTQYRTYPFQLYWLPSERTLQQLDKLN